MCRNAQPREPALKSWIMGPGTHLLGQGPAHMDGAHASGREPLPHPNPTTQTPCDGRFTKAASADELRFLLVAHFLLPTSVFYPKLYFLKGPVVEHYVLIHPQGGSLCIDTSSLVYA